MQNSNEKIELVHIKLPAGAAAARAGLARACEGLAAWVQGSPRTVDIKNVLVEQ